MKERSLVIGGGKLSLTMDADDPSSVFRELKPKGGDWKSFLTQVNDPHPVDNDDLFEKMLAQMNFK